MKTQSLAGERMLRRFVTSAAALAAVLVGLTTTPLGAAGDPSLDQHIRAPVASWPQVTFPAGVLSQVSRIENNASLGLHATVAGRVYRSSSTHFAEVLLVQFSGTTNIADLAQAAVASAVGTFCAGVAGHSAASAPVPSIPTAQMVSCGRSVNGTSPRAIAFARGNVLALVVISGASTSTLVQASQRQYRALPPTTTLH